MFDFFQNLVHRVALLWLWISLSKPGSWGFPTGSDSKNLPMVQENWVRSLGWEDPLEKEMANNSNIFAWRISRTQEPGGLPLGSQRVGHNRGTNSHTHTHNLDLKWCLVYWKFLPKENFCSAVLEEVFFHRQLILLGTATRKVRNNDLEL